MTNVTRVAMEKKVLSANDQIAARLRDAIQSLGTLVVNLISSPGSGKTMLLEKTLASAAGRNTGRGSYRRHPDRERCSPLGSLRLSRSTDHHRRRVPSGCADGGKSPGRLARH